LMHLYRFYSFFLTYLIVKEHFNSITNYESGIKSELFVIPDS